MADILIYPWPIASHAMATLKIAKTLRSAGHTVVYVTVGAENPVIRESGFVQEVIFSDEMPDGARRIFANRSERQVDRFFRENLPGIVSRLERTFDELLTSGRRVAGTPRLLWNMASYTGNPRRRSTQVHSSPGVRTRAKQ